MLEEISKGELHAEGLTKTQEDLALSLFDAGVIKFDFEVGWLLKHHEEYPDAPRSPFYIDLRILQSLTKKDGVKQEAVTALIELSKDLEFDCIVGVPSAAIPLAATMADRIEVPQIMPRKEKKTHGLATPIDGLWEGGQTVLVIDDLVTTAKSKLEVIEVLKENGLIVNDVVVIFDREQGGAEELKREGYQLHAALKIKPTLEFYVRAGKITQEEHDRVMDYLADPLGEAAQQV